MVYKRISSEPDPMLIGRPLARCDSVLVAAPAHLAAHDQPQTPDELTRHRCQAMPTLAKVSGTLPAMTIYALYSFRRHLSPAVRALLDFLVQRFTPLPW